LNGFIRRTIGNTKYWRERLRRCLDFGDHRACQLANEGYVIWGMQDNAATVNTRNSLWRL